MAEPGLLVIAIIFLIGALYSAAVTGIGWHVLRTDDSCKGGMYTYLKAITITATVQLAIYAVGGLLALLSFICDCLEGIAAIVDGVLLFITAVIGNILCLVWLVWGIILLVNHHCEGTVYHTITIVFVVLSGIGMLGNSCSMCRRRE